MTFPATLSRSVIKNQNRERDFIVVPKVSKNTFTVTQEEIREITQFCRKHCLTPVAVGAPQFWIKNYIVCSPFQCLKMFARADFVVTDTFHGTIFASKYSKKFAVLVRESNRNKLGDLLKKIEMQEHVVMEISKLDEKYKMKKDMKNFQNIIEKEKEKSLQYLRKNIGD